MKIKVLLSSMKVLVLEDPQGLICKSLSLSVSYITKSLSLTLNTFSADLY